MKKEYIAPVLETVKFNLNDVLLLSIPEETIPEIIGGGGDDGGDPIDIEGL